MQPRCQGDVDRTGAVDVGWPTLDQSLGGRDGAFRMSLSITGGNTHTHSAMLDSQGEREKTAVGKNARKGDG